MSNRTRQRYENTSGISISLQRIALFIAIIFLNSAFRVSLTQVSAQSAAMVTVEPPDLNAFPNLTVEFKCLDANKQPLTGFTTDQVSLTENGIARPIDDLIQEYRGVHFTLAINGNRDLDLRDSNGVSRYEKLTGALKEWAGHHELMGEDALSLVTNDGVLIHETTDLRAWRSALEAYQPNLRQMEPDLASLEMALQFIQEEALHFGVDQALLYITPPPTAAQIVSLNALTQEARSAGIRVDVWMAGEDLYLSNDQGRALISLAMDTGGQFFHFTGLENIPNLDALHTDLGYVETLAYTSALKESGDYTIELTVDLGGVSASGEGQPFHIEVLPLNPIFLSPPAEIERQWVGEKDAQTLIPSSKPLSILVEFPDGHPRALSASQLLVDGVAVAVNNNAPFDSFTWDLSSLQESGEHTIQVEVEDQLGLSASTIVMPVQVRILEPETAPKVNWQKIMAIAAGGVAAAAILLLVFWLLRQFWQSQSMKDLCNRIFPPTADISSEPVSVEVADADPLATFIPLDSFFGDADPEAIAITQLDTTLTNNPEEGLLVEIPNVKILNVHLIFRDDVLWLENHGEPNSVWVNYERVGNEAIALDPGDLVHFGNSGFRFTINSGSTPLKVSVSKYEPLT
jgi:hypothetical protein